MSKRYEIGAERVPMLSAKRPSPVVSRPTDRSGDSEGDSLTVEVAKPTDRLYCASCWHRVRYRKVSTPGYIPDHTWRAPSQCQFCGLKSKAGDLTIAVIHGD